MGRVLPGLMLLAAAIVAWMVFEGGSEQRDTDDGRGIDHAVDDPVSDVAPPQLATAAKKPTKTDVSEDEPSTIVEPEAAPVGLVRPLEARVVSMSDRIVEGAQVTARRISNGQHSRAVTDEHGVFKIDLRVGRFDITIRSAEQGTLVVRDFVHDGPGEDERVFKLGAYATVRVVVERGAKPVPDARIYITPHRRLGSKLAKKNDQDEGEPESVREEIKTDAQGIAVVEGLPADQYDIYVRIEHGAPEVMTRWTHKATRWVQNTTTVDFLFPAPTTLVGSVRAHEPGEKGARIAATIVLKISLGYELPPIKTLIKVNSTSDFRTTVPKSRLDFVRVSAEGYPPWPLFRRHSEVRRALSNKLGYDDARFDVVLRKGNSVTGRVTWEDGTPAKGIRLAFRGAPNNIVSAGRNGTYTVHDLPPGRQSAALHTPRVYFVEDTNVVTFGEEDVGMTNTLDIPIRRARTIQGIVEWGNGTPQPGARVWMRTGGRDPGTNPHRVTYSDQKGLFRFRDVSPHDDLEEVLRASLGSAEAPPVYVDADHPVEDAVCLTLEETQTVGGYVREKNGAAVPGAEVRFNPVGGAGHTPLSTRTNGQGKYAVGGLLPGRWRVQTSHARYLSTGRPYDVYSTAGSRFSKLDLKLDAGTEFSGRVTDATKGPLAGVRIRCRKIRKKPWEPLETIVTTDAQGKFRITGLRGKRRAFRLNCLKVGYAPVQWTPPTKSPNKHDQEALIVMKALPK